MLKVCGGRESKRTHTSGGRNQKGGLESDDAWLGGRNGATPASALDHGGSAGFSSEDHGRSKYYVYYLYLPNLPFLLPITSNMTWVLGQTAQAHASQTLKQQIWRNHKAACGGFPIFLFPKATLSPPFRGPFACSTFLRCALNLIQILFTRPVFDGFVECLEVLLGSYSAKGLNNYVCRKPS